jgi:hypothetical protein
MDFQALMAQAREDHRRLRDEIIPANKAAIMAALAAAGIGSVIVRFDGEGDSGQIDAIEAYSCDTPSADAPDADLRLELPDRDLSQRVREYDVATRQTDWVEASGTLRDAIENLAYALLEIEHDGWENNDGGYGEFIFSVPRQTITLTFNMRISEIATYDAVF